MRKTPVESKYADKDREYAAKNLPVATTDDKAAIQAAQEAADLIAAQELFGSACTLATKTPKTNGEFEEYAQQLFEKYVLIHKNSKQWKFFIKSIVRQACEPFSKEEMKDIEAVVASVRSDKVKADIAAAKELRKGVLLPLTSVDQSNTQLSAVVLFSKPFLDTLNVQILLLITKV